MSATKRFINRSSHPRLLFNAYYTISELQLLFPRINVSSLHRRLPTGSVITDATLVLPKEQAASPWPQFESTAHRTSSKWLSKSLCQRDSRQSLQGHPGYTSIYSSSCMLQLLYLGILVVSLQTTHRHGRSHAKACLNLRAMLQLYPIDHFRFCR